jgi:hypothetical protein
MCVSCAYLVFDDRSDIFTTLHRNHHTLLSVGWLASTPYAIKRLIESRNDVSNQVRYFAKDSIDITLK